MDASCCDGSWLNWEQLMSMRVVAMVRGVFEKAVVDVMRDDAWDFDS